MAITDRVAVIADFQNALYDQRNASLFALFDYFHCYHYPQLGSGERNNIAGPEGMPVYVQIPFQVQTAASGGITPQLGKVTISVVAIKTNEPDFIVESFPMNIAAACLYQNVQQAAVSNNRNYNSWNGDPYNAISLKANNTYSSGTMAGYLLSYGMVLRYDYWASILASMPGFTPCSAINNDLPNVNNKWSNLQGNGWSLVLRLYVEVTGYDGFVTGFQSQVAITTADPDTTQAFIYNMLYFDMNGNPLQGLQKGNKTLVYAVAYPTQSIGVPAGYTDYFGYIFADLQNIGGPTSRRFASSELPSEVNSPWSAPTSILLNQVAPDVFRANGNAAIGIYNATGVVVVASIYDDTVSSWSSNANPTLLSPYVGFQNLALQNNTGNDLLNNNGNVLLNN